eukprot:gene8926-9847_t
MENSGTSSASSSGVTKNDLPPFYSKIARLRASDPIEETKRWIVDCNKQWEKLNERYSVHPSLPRCHQYNSIKHTGELRQVQTLLDCEIEDLPDHIKEDYCIQLADLFQQIPSLRTITSSSASSSSSSHPVSLSDTTSLLTKQALPLLNNKIPPSQLVVLSPASDIIISEVEEDVFVWGFYHIRSGQLEQVVEVLASQTLHDLHQASYCIQKQVGYDTPSKAFFFIENIFYEEEEEEGEEEEDRVEESTSTRLSSNVDSIMTWLRKDSSSVNEMIEGEEEEVIDGNVAPPLVSIPASVSSVTSRGGNSQKGSMMNNAALAQALLAALEAQPSLPTAGKKRQRIEQAQRPRRKVVPQPTTPSFAYGVNPNTLQKASMKTAVLRDLNPIIGEKYLYCHEHCCEHLLSLIDVRRPRSVMQKHFFDLNAGGQSHSVENEREVSDVNLSYREHFPRETFRFRFRNSRKCEVCELFPAECMTYHDRLASATSHDKQQIRIAAFFCKNCFQMLHYGVGGQLLYDDFLYYPYPHSRI